MHTNIHAHTPTHTNTHAYTHTNTHARTHTHIHTHTRTHARTYTHTLTHTHTYIPRKRVAVSHERVGRVPTRTHTYIHTYIPHKRHSTFEGYRKPREGWTHFPKRPQSKSYQMGKNSLDLGQKPVCVCDVYICIYLLSNGSRLTDRCLKPVYM
jgi:hypothetical protein